MYCTFTARGGHKWIDILEDLVNGYNNTRHSSTKFAPNYVNEENEHFVRENLYPQIKKEVKHTIARFIKHFALQKRNSFFKRDMIERFLMMYSQSVKLRTLTL